MPPDSSLSCYVFVMGLIYKICKRIRGCTCLKTNPGEVQTNPGVHLFGDESGGAPIPGTNPWVHLVRGNINEGHGFSVP